MSCRFYEILSLGRIPLFIDTDCVLPLEDIISYEDFMLRIDYKNIDNICKAVDDFYSKTGDEDFLKMQKNAREVYEKYLTPVNFLQYILPKIKNIK